MLERVGDAQETDEDRGGGHEGGTAENQGPSADLGGDEEGNDDTDDGHGVLSDTKVERGRSWNTSLLQEVDNVRDERDTELLDDICEDCDLGAAKVLLAEKIRVCARGSLLVLDLDGVLHQGHGVADLLLGAALGLKLSQGLLGIFGAALSNEPPWRLGRKVDADRQRDGQDPLHGKGDSVSPLALHGEEASEGAGSDEVADTPAHGDQHGEVGPEDVGGDLGGICRGDGLEDTPWDAEEETGAEVHVDAGGEELKGDEAHHQEETAQHDESVTEPISQETVEQKANDLANVDAVSDGGLEVGRHLVVARGLELAVALLEGGEGEEGGDEGLVETLHDQGGGEEEGPGAGLGILLETLDEAKLVLGLVGLLGTLEEVIAVEVLLLVLAGEDVDGAGVLAVFLVLNHVDKRLSLSVCVVCGGAEQECDVEMKVLPCKLLHTEEKGVYMLAESVTATP